MNHRNSLCFHSWVKQKSLAAHFLPVKLISMNTIIAKKIKLLWPVRRLRFDM